MGFVKEVLLQSLKISRISVSRVKEENKIKGIV